MGAIHQPPLLSTVEVAKCLGFSVRTIIAWAAEWQESEDKEVSHHSKSAAASDAESELWKPVS